MKGRVYVEYRRLGLYAVETEDNEFSIIEVRNGHLSLLDELIGALKSLGDKRLYNDTTKKELEVSVRSIHITLAEAKSYIKDAARWTCK